MKANAIRLLKETFSDWSEDKAPRLRASAPRSRTTLSLQSDGFSPGGPSTVCCVDCGAGLVSHRGFVHLVCLFQERCLRAIGF
jgi:hypothetical protein